MSPKLFESFSEKNGRRFSSGEFIGERDDDDDEVIDGDGEPQSEVEEPAQVVKSLLMVGM